MPNEVRLWHIGSADKLNEIERSSLDLETRLQKWIPKDISVLDPGLYFVPRFVSFDSSSRGTRYGY